MGYQYTHVHRDGDITLCRVLAADFFGDAVSSTLSRELTEVVTRAQPQMIVLDLSAVTRYSSLFVGILVSVRNKVVATGGTLHLCGVSPELADYLTRISLDTLLPIFASEDEAKSAF